MDYSGQIRTLLLGLVLVLCLGMSVGQRDCTGVDCPVMDNCIEEVLERGACCASCLKRGCACEGYQYYDCLNAGFRGGKVPEGESYFVDFGSTECSCPSGGGRITCHFIPCPDIPQNCIETVTPMDGCAQCERIGCVHQSQKYEAGHTFQMSPCEVCHCPNDGGSLMCSPVPGCDPQKVKKPMLASTTEDGDSQAHPGTFSNFLPLYKEDPTDTPTDEDYDYPTDLTTADTQDEPAEPTSPPPSFSETSSSHDSFGGGPRQELREAQGAYEIRNAEDHMSSPPSAADTTTSRLQEETMAADKAQAPKHHGPPREASEGQSRRHAEETQRGAQERDLPHTAHSESDPRHKTHHEHRDSHAAGQEENHLPDSRDGRQDNALPLLKFSPSRPPPVNVREDRKHTQRRQSQTLLHYHTAEEEEHGSSSSSSPYSHQLSAKELVEVCCEAGEKWATVHGHCSNMAAVREDTHSICWSAQKQCCSGSLKERKCLAGVTAAKQGDACELDDNDHCGVDSYKECCSCCSLGLHFRKEGLPCEAHQYLGFPCSHVFLTCCEGEEAASWSTLRQRLPLQPTTPPKRVSDSPYPKEAFSIGDAEDAENTVEGAEGLRDLDECKLYEGKLCHHTCINTQGSYLCACYPGYTLQEDGRNCEPETDAEEENRLREQEHESPAAAAETTTAPAPPTTTTTVYHDPCAGNGPCAQRCIPVEGRPQCSCFPGFSLAADGLSCEDVNECLLMTHNCQLNERCVNTAGHYFCEGLIVCPAGYQENNNVCEDIDECAQRTHNCRMGYECRNTPGSFTCQTTARCSGGFTQDAIGHCVDVDECSSIAQPCTPGFNCINTVGSYTCQRKVIICSRGYHASPDGNRCIDVDECQTGVHRCGDGQTCHNLPGTYRCECQPGYQYDMFRKTCVDVNECWRYPGRLCAQTCENTPGSYQCSCTAGFRLSSDGKNCEDVNECLNNPCGQECANIYGSYQCYCRQGYHLQEDGHSCDDIDECSQSMGHMCTFKCVNVEGSYQCACPEYGYTMSPNGRSCLDIDECAIGTHNCSVSETCYNIQGDHRCLSFNCPDNYRRVSDTRCERINCPNFVECQNSPLRITYYQLSFQTNTIIPAQIFRIGPSPAYSGDNIIISIPRGNEENYFSTRKLNTYTGAVYLHRQPREPRDFLIDVEMRLWRQGTFTTFLARIYVFITAPAL